VLKIYRPVGAYQETQPKKPYHIPQQSPLRFSFSKSFLIPIKFLDEVAFDFFVEVVGAEPFQEP
jgi:hypothetical protein